MTSKIWLSILLSTCIAQGCSTSAPPELTGFTFESDPGSFTSFGWTGGFHNIVQGPQTPFGVKTTDCRDGLCRFEGPTDPRGAVKRRRCLARTSTVCETDEDCPLSGTDPTSCVYVYDAPIVTPLQGTDGLIGACAWTYIPLGSKDQPSIAGSLNLASGALNLDNFTLNLVLNIDSNNNFRGVCSECVGDVTPNDGVKDGTCQLATHKDPTNPADPSEDVGQPCDVNRNSRLGVYQANYSMDCSPSVKDRATPPPDAPRRTPLSLGGSYSSSGKELTLSTRSPTCAGGVCYCGMCEKTATACMSDAECGDERCTAPRDVVVLPSRCPDTCLWNSERGVGTCPRAVPDNGSAPDIYCYPSKLGSKLLIPGNAHREDGIETTYRVQTGGARCIPSQPDANAALNAQVGLPGLLFQKRNFRIIPSYDGETK